MEGDVSPRSTALTNDLVRPASRATSSCVMSRAWRASRRRPPTSLAGQRSDASALSGAVGGWNGMDRTVAARRRQGNAQKRSICSQVLYWLTSVHS